MYRDRCRYNTYMYRCIYGLHSWALVLDQDVRVADCPLQKGDVLRCSSNRFGVFSRPQTLNSLGARLREREQVYGFGLRIQAFGAC